MRRNPTAETRHPAEPQTPSPRGSEAASTEPPGGCTSLAPDSIAEAEPQGLSVRVNVCGEWTDVLIDKQRTLGAVATTARWQTGYGHIAFDAWEVRNERGILLKQQVPAGATPRVIFVNRTPGVGA